MEGDSEGENEEAVPEMYFTKKIYMKRKGRPSDLLFRGLHRLLLITISLARVA